MTGLKKIFGYSFKFFISKYLKAYLFSQNFKKIKIQSNFLTFFIKKRTKYF